jgi:hypothetical protein
MDVFVCWDGDKIGRRVGRAVLDNDVGEVRRVDQAINAGNELWRNLALNVGGNVVEVGGDEGRIIIDASHLGDMPGVAERYAETVGASVSVGVGTKLSESAKALVVAKLRGGNRICVWDPEMEPEYLAATKPETEQNKIAKEYFDKAEPPKHAEETGHSAVGTHSAHMTGENHGPGAGFSVQHKPGFSDIKPSDEGPAKPVDAPPNPLSQISLNAPGGAGGSNPEDDMHAAAQGQAQQDAQDSTNGMDDQEKLKKVVHDALQGVRKQLPAIQRLQATSPDAYKSILQLVQGVILMGKAIMQPAGDGAQQGDPDPQYVQAALNKAGDIASAPPANGEMGMSEESMEKDDVPVGTVVDQKMKVQHSDGGTSWKSMESGMIASQDGGSQPDGANSHPTSSREPSAR